MNPIPRRVSQRLSQRLFSFATAFVWGASQLEAASAAQFDSLKNALTTTLKSKDVYNKKVMVDGKPTTIFYAKGAGGKPSQVAMIEKGIYEPNCTHTWVIGIDPKTSKVQQIRVVEMSCAHAYPTNKPGFLDQYKGKGPADVAKLADSITTIAKATGSCNLTTDAVKRSIVAWNQGKGQF